MLEPPTSQFCPSDEISAYIDGELSPARELELDRHFASCRSCNLELNDLKQFLRGLDDTLRVEGDLDLPKDFTLLIPSEATMVAVRRAWWSGDQMGIKFMGEFTPAPKK